jgi:hypothetical protein
MERDSEVIGRNCRFRRLLVSDAEPVEEASSMNANVRFYLFHTSTLLSLSIFISGAQAQFVQQGDKLLGTIAVGNAQQGNSAALSSNARRLL